MSWGKLTGVRPVKLIHLLRQQGLNQSEIFNHLKYNVEISDDIIDLLWRIADEEQRLIAPYRVGGKQIALFINIPFCPSRCTYCSFITIANLQNQELIDQYLNTLIQEIDELADYLRSAELSVAMIYLGGGTPTILTVNQLEKLFLAIALMPSKPKLEYTVEAGRPDTVDREKLQLMLDYEVTRVSINPQTMNNETLRRVNRHHTAAQIREKVYLAHQLGFDVNMDLILGLPGENLSNVYDSLNQVLKIKPANITIHNLAQKRTATLTIQHDHELANYSVIEKMNRYSTEALQENGYHPYYLYRQKGTVGGFPNIGYVRKDSKPCVYNSAMISELLSVYGCGAGAVTKILNADQKFTRLAAPKDASIYINKYQEFQKKKLRWYHEIK